MYKTTPKEQRYGIMRAKLDPTENDPFWFEIDYWDRPSKTQGRVKLMLHQVPQELLIPLNEALNAIVGHGLSLVTVETTDYAVGQSFHQPYPEVVFDAGTPEQD